MTTVVEEAVFGTADGARIAALVDECCRRTLGAPVARRLFTAI